MTTKTVTHLHCTNCDRHYLGGSGNGFVPDPNSAQHWQQKLSRTLTEDEATMPVKKCPVCKAQQSTHVRPTKYKLPEAVEPTGFLLNLLPDWLVRIFAARAISNQGE